MSGLNSCCLGLFNRKSQKQPPDVYKSDHAPSKGQLFDSNRPSLVYQRGREISVSKWATVFEGLTADGELMVVKRYKFPRDLEIQNICLMLRKLIDHTRTLTHENLSRYLGCDYFPEKGELCIYTEYIPSNDESIYKCFQTEQLVRYFVLCLLQALKFLNDKGFKRVGNIKRSNLLLDNNMVVKLRDYVGNDYIDTIKKQAGDVGDNQRQTRSGNDDLRQVSKLMLEFGFRVKLSPVGVEFLRLVDTLAKDQEINFEKLMEHPFIQTAQLDRERGFRPDTLYQSTPSISPISVEKEATVKQNEPDAIRYAPPPQIQQRKQPSREEVQKQPLPEPRPNFLPKLNLKSAKSFRFEREKLLASRNQSPSEKSSTTSKNLAASQSNENASRLSIYLAQQNSIIKKMQAQLASANISAAPDELNQSWLRNVSERQLTVSDNEGYKSTKDFLENDIIRILKVQNAYIKYLEAEAMARMEENTERRDTNGGSNGSPHSVNNNTVNTFYINNIYSNDGREAPGRKSDRPAQPFAKQTPAKMSQQALPIKAPPSQNPIREVRRPVPPNTGNVLQRMSSNLSDESAEQIGTRKRLPEVLRENRERHNFRKDST